MPKVSMSLGNIFESDGVLFTTIKKDLLQNVNFVNLVLVILCDVDNFSKGEQRLT